MAKRIIKYGLKDGVLGKAKEKSMRQGFFRGLVRGV
jgi:hypothetical protein